MRSAMATSASSPGTPRPSAPAAAAPRAPGAAPPPCRAESRCAAVAASDAPPGAPSWPSTSCSGVCEIGVAEALDRRRRRLGRTPATGMRAFDAHDRADADRRVERRPEMELVRRVRLPLGRDDRGRAVRRSMRRWIGMLRVARSPELRCKYAVTMRIIDSRAAGMAAPRYSSQFRIPYTIVSHRPSGATPAIARPAPRANIRRRPRRGLARGVPRHFDAHQTAERITSGGSRRRRYQLATGDRHLVTISNTLGPLSLRRVRAPWTDRLHRTYSVWWLLTTRVRRSDSSTRVRVRGVLHR